jgi:hypothetical protein
MTINITGNKYNFVLGNKIQMITSGINYLFYNDDSSLNDEKTEEALLSLFEELSKEDAHTNIFTHSNEEKAHIYVVCTTPSSAHWYEKPIAGAQGSYYSHTGISFDKKMSALYHVRNKGLIVSKRNEFKREKIAFDIFEYEVKAAEKQRAQHLVSRMKMMETKYDYLMIGKLLGKIILRRKDKVGDKNVTEEEVLNRQRYICSGFVAGVLAATVSRFRRYLFHAKKRWTTFTPQDFVNVDGLVLKRRIIFPENKVLLEFDK